MRRIVSFAAALLVMFGAASCEKESMNGSSVLFNFEIPTGTVTRADMSDGSTVNELVYEVYVGDDVMYEGSVGRNTDGKFTLALNLVKGMEYDLLFWAQVKGNPYYNTDVLKKVTVSYEGNANDEKRDAFYGSCLNFKPSATPPPTVYLTRPFAQVNFGSSEKDWTAAKPFVVDAKGNVNVSSMATFANVPNVFDVEKGDVVEGEFVKEVDFRISPAPIAEAKYSNDFISYNNAQYAWVMMNYILAPKDNPATAEFEGLNIDIPKAAFVHLKNASAPLTQQVWSVPVAQNYRTNILGDIFTQGTDFEIVINPGFTDDKVVVIPQK